MKKSNKRILIVTSDLSYPAGALMFASHVIKALYETNCELFIWTNRYADMELEDNRIPKIQWLKSNEFFKHGHGIIGKLKRIKEEFRFLKAIMNIKPNACLVVTDRPRFIYKIAESWTKVILYLHEVSMTCPGDPGFRFLKKSKTICAQLPGLSCLKVDKIEGCLGQRPVLRQIQRIWRTLVAIKVMQSMKYLVANSSYTARTVSQGSFNCKPYILAPVIVFDDMSSNINKRAPETRFRVAYIGRLEEEKGIYEALHILAMLPVYYKLIIVGQGSAERNAKKLAEKLGVTQRVKFMGWMSRMETYKEIASSGIVLMPSLCAEGFGMVGPEALSTGTPIVAYKAGGISDWCKDDFAQCVSLCDRSAAARAIVSITYNQELWEELCFTAREYFINNFDPSTNLKKLLTFIGMYEEDNQ